MASIKRGKWQRKNSIPAAPPTPQESEHMAAQGISLNRGSSTEVPLSEGGKQEVADTADKLAQKGGFDSLTTSPAARAEETAQAIAEKNPKPLQASNTPNLLSWSQGNLEGVPKVLAKKQIDDLIRKNPSYVIPGQGAATNLKGESFDSFRTRYLSAIRGAMQQLADTPTAKIGIVSHSMGLKLVRAWLANGAPDDFSIKPEEMIDDVSEKVGQVDRLFPDKDGEWELVHVDLESPEPLQSGIFLLRHGMTGQNTENYAAEGQRARAEIAKHLKSLDFESLRNTAMEAKSKKHLSDDEISSAIDGSLPSAKDVEDLPPHQLLAVASAASPTKRMEYAPAVNNVFGDLSSLPTSPRNLLAGHLGRIGMGRRNQPQGVPHAG